MEKKIKLPCSICKKDARRKRGRKLLKELGLKISATDTEPIIILCEDCRDRINSHYDY